MYVHMDFYGFKYVKYKVNIGIILLISRHSYIHMNESKEKPRNVEILGNGRKLSVY